MSLILNNDSQILSCAQIILETLHSYRHTYFVEIIRAKDTSPAICRNFVYDHTDHARMGSASHEA
jgi:hypothetical protein